MKERPLHTIFSLALAIAVSFSMLIAPLGHLEDVHAADTSQTEAAHMSVPSHAHHHDHGHSHDHHFHDGDDQHSGHSHGHNPGDHSHDLPVPLNLRGDMRTPIGNLWASVTPRSHDQGQLFGLDRPPRT